MLSTQSALCMVSSSVLHGRSNMNMNHVPQLGGAMQCRARITSSLCDLMVARFGTESAPTTCCRAETTAWFHCWGAWDGMGSPGRAEPSPQNFLRRPPFGPPFRPFFLGLCDSSAAGSSLCDCCRGNSSSAPCCWACCLAR